MKGIMKGVMRGENGYRGIGARGRGRGKRGK